MASIYINMKPFKKLTIPQHDTIAPNTPAGVTPTAPWRVDQVTVLLGFRLRVRFMDGLEGAVDCSALVQSEAAGVFAPLRQENLFDQAYVSLGVVTGRRGRIWHLMRCMPHSPPRLLAA